jgi:hypothetical protein
MPEWSNQSDGFDCRQPHRTAVTTGAVGELDRELAGHRGSEEQLLFVGASFIGDGPKCVEVSAGIQSFTPQLLRTQYFVPTCPTGSEVETGDGHSGVVDANIVISTRGSGRQARSMTPRKIQVSVNSGVRRDGPASCSGTVKANGNRRFSAWGKSI